MKAYGQIGLAEANNIKPYESQTFRCGGTIAAGSPVALIDNTALAALNTAAAAAGKPQDYYAGNVIAVCDVDLNNPTLGYVFGVAEEAGVAGEWIEVCTFGIGKATITTDGSVDEGDVLIPTATAGTVGGTAGETQDLLGFAIALSADSSTSLAEGNYFVLRRW